MQNKLVFNLSFSITPLLLLLLFFYTLPFSLVTDSNAQIDNAAEQATLKRSEDKKMEAYGRIATNQIQNGSVSWIQAGLWYMTIAFNELDNNKNAYFYTDFTMVKPDEVLCINISSKILIRLM